MRHRSDSRQFSEILEEKLNKTTVFHSQKESFTTSTTDSLHEELSHLGLKEVLFRAKKYPLKKENPTLWKPIGLSKPLIEAFEFFHINGEIALNDRSSQENLKRSFRRLARRLHPDTVASQGKATQKIYSDNFLKLHNHYKELEIFLRRNKKSAA